MAEQKTGWWQTVPGLLTAAAAFIAALTGLLTGLNQLGVFERAREPAEQSGVAANPGPADAGRPIVTPEPVPADSAPMAAARPEPRPRPAKRPAEPKPPAPAAVPTDTAPATGHMAPPLSDTAADAARPEAPSADTTPAPTAPVPEGDTTAPPRDTAAAADTGPIVQPAPVARDAVLPSGTVLELAASNRVCSTTSSPKVHCTLAL